VSERVLLVEDDPSVGRFVAMALEDLPIELVVCTSVAAALDALRAQSVRLLITDLMLPGESGLSLLETLRNQPALRQDALLVVFSAGVSPEIRHTLDALQVWRILSKPVSVVALEACVCDALQLHAGGAHEPTNGEDDLTPEARLAVAAHFAGDAVLFRTYRDSCFKQFAHDRLAGDQALAKQDTATLRRLAHSLATVLQTLGFQEAGAVARGLEAAAEKADLQAISDGWAQLRPCLSTKSEA
jgi:DNA-binding response OmpR family regulator